MKFYEEFYKNLKNNINVDVFDIMYFLQSERMNRTIWCSCGGKSTAKMIIDEMKRLESKNVAIDKSYIGIPLFIRKKRGRKTGKKKEKEATDAFIEFIMPNSVNRLQKVATTDGFMVNRKRAKFFRAGTKPDFFLVKKKIYT